MLNLSDLDDNPALSATSVRVDLYVAEGVAVSLEQLEQCGDRLSVFPGVDEYRKVVSPFGR